MDVTAKVHVVRTKATQLMQDKMAGELKSLDAFIQQYADMIMDAIERKLFASVVTPLIAAIEKYSDSQALSKAACFTQIEAACKTFTSTTFTPSSGKLKLEQLLGNDLAKQVADKMEVTTSIVTAIGNFNTHIIPSLIDEKSPPFDAASNALSIFLQSSDDWAAKSQSSFISSTNGLGASLGVLAQEARTRVARHRLSDLTALKVVQLLKELTTMSHDFFKPGIGRLILLDNGYDADLHINVFRKAFVITTEVAASDPSALNVKYDLASVNLAGGFTEVTTLELMMLGAVLPYINRVQKIVAIAKRTTTLPKLYTAISKMAEPEAQGRESEVRKAITYKQLTILDFFSLVDGILAVRSKSVGALQPFLTAHMVQIIEHIDLAFFTSLTMAHAAYIEDFQSSVKSLAATLTPLCELETLAMNKPEGWQAEVVKLGESRVSGELFTGHNLIKNYLPHVGKRAVTTVDVLSLSTFKGIDAADKVLALWGDAKAMLANVDANQYIPDDPLQDLGRTMGNLTIAYAAARSLAEGEASRQVPMDKASWLSQVLRASGP